MEGNMEMVMAATYPEMKRDLIDLQIIPRDYSTC